MRPANTQNVMFQIIASAAAAAFVVGASCAAFMTGRESAYRQAQAEARKENEHLDKILKLMNDSLFSQIRYPEKPSS